MFKFASAAIGIAGFVALGSSAASAASILLDHGDSTYDPSTHLEWLDLTKTQGLSYDQVINNSGVSYYADGWTYATKAQLEGFFTDAGGTDTYPNSLAGQADHDTALGLMNLIGITESDTAHGYLYQRSLGFVQDGGGPSLSLVAAAENATLESAFFAAYSAQSSSFSFGTIGSFLVRESTVSATPIPAALPLFASALGGLGFVGWRRKQAAGAA